MSICNTQQVLASGPSSNPWSLKDIIARRLYFGTLIIVKDGVGVYAGKTYMGTTRGHCNSSGPDSSLFGLVKPDTHLKDRGT